MQPVSRSALLAVGSLAVATVSAAGLPRALQHLTTAPFPEALVTVARLALVVVATWLALVVLLDLGGQRPRGLARRLTPRWAQGLLLASVGSIATVVPAHAAPSTLDGLPLPDRPSVAITTTDAVPPVPVTVPAPRTHLMVRSGDTLWDIAARWAGPDADTADVARAVQRWHETNRTTIGPDPDHIVPGQVLTTPRGDRS